MGETFYIDKKCESALKLFGNDCIRTVFGLSKSGPPLPLMLLTGILLHKRRPLRKEPKRF